MATSLGVPAYRSLAAELPRQILEGAYPRGRRLPTEAELSSSFNLSRQTVRQAFAELVMEGLVYRVPGRGTFATLVPTSGAYMRSFGSIDELLSLSEDTELEVVTPLEEVADEASADQLQCDDGRVWRVEFVRLHDGVAFSFTRLDLRSDLGPQMQREQGLLIAGHRSTITITAAIERHTSVTVAHASQAITALGCSPDVARLLGMKPGEPSLRIERVYYDPEGRPVDLARNDFNPNRYTHRIELRRTGARGRLTPP